MRKIEYLFYLLPEQEDRLRVIALKEKKEILEFTVQYEAFIQEKWKPIVRYDTRHGFAHKDLLHPNGALEKQPLHFLSYNLAFTYATQELKQNWRRYRKNYQEEIK